MSRCSAESRIFDASRICTFVCVSEDDIWKREECREESRGNLLEDKIIAATGIDLQFDREVKLID